MHTTWLGAGPTLLPGESSLVTVSVHLRVHRWVYGCAGCLPEQRVHVSRVATDVCTSGCMCALYVCVNVHECLDVHNLVRAHVYLCAHRWVLRCVNVCMFIVTYASVHARVCHVCACMHTWAYVYAQVSICV